MRGGLALAGFAAAAVLMAGAGATYDWGLPAGVAPPPVPADNPMSQAKVELGRRLFYDADLSADGTLACATCHEQKRGFAEDNATHPGVGGALGRRNAPGLADVGYFRPLTWADPTLTSLERQAATPITGEHPVEMGMHGREAELVRRLSADACYRRMFERAFPETSGEISFAGVAKALAAFQRTLLSWGSDYDRKTSSDEAKAGRLVFQAKGCASCHSGPDFTDQRFHAVGTGTTGDAGVFKKTGKEAQRGAFRTPSLRNVALTAPYLHDGSARTIRFAIFSHRQAARGLSQDDATAIEVFLDSLTDEGFIRNPRFSMPRAFCGRARTS